MLLTHRRGSSAVLCPNLDVGCAAIGEGWQQSLVQELKVALESQAEDVDECRVGRNTLVHGLLEVRKTISSLHERFSPARCPSLPILGSSHDTARNTAN